MKSSGQGGQKRRISPARVAAFDVLLRIETRSAFSSILLPQVTEDLDPRDRGLAYELVLGTLRRQIHLDRVIGLRAGRKRIDPEVRIAIRLGLYQLLYLDKVPHHSAINESVELVNRAKKTSAKGFVNAVLRGTLRDGAELNYADLIDRVSVETSHPRWLIERWRDEFGEETAFRIAEANNDPPPAAFRRTAKGGDVPLPADIRPSMVVAGCFLADGSGQELRGLADEGRIYFQDEGSQMVAAVVTEYGGTRFLDACAAPGSKTTQIAAAGVFSTIVAGDLHGRRVAGLRENCRIQGVEQVMIAQFDAERGLPFEDKSFDTVLVDAPCSGTGTIRSNPEIRYTVQPEHFDQLHSKQRRILVNASKTVKERGFLIYSTCSLEKDENEAVVAGFLAEQSGWSVVKPPVAGRFVTDDGFARTFPQRDEMDGFFIAVLRRS